MRCSPVFHDTRVGSGRVSRFLLRHDVVLEVVGSIRSASAGAGGLPSSSVLTWCSVSRSFFASGAQQALDLFIGDGSSRSPTIGRATHTCVLAGRGRDDRKLMYGHRTEAASRRASLAISELKRGRAIPLHIHKCVCPLSLASIGSLFQSVAFRRKHGAPTRWIFARSSKRDGLVFWGHQRLVRRWRRN